MHLKVLFIGICILFFSACITSDQSNKPSSLENNDVSEEMLQPANSYKISPTKESINIILRSIPSPLDFAHDLKGSDLDKTFISKPHKADDFVSSADMAIALGMYSVDLSYINIFKETSLSSEYYSTIMELARKLYVEQFFNATTVEELKKNEKNTERLIEIVRNSYNNINDYLKTHEKQDLSYLILYGSWVESVNITLKHYNQGLKNVHDKIGYQKITIQKLINVFNTLPNQPNVNEVKKDLESLSMLFQTVDIVYEPVVLNDSGEVILNTNNDAVLQEPTIKMDDNTIQQITSVFQALKNKYQHK